MIGASATRDPDRPIVFMFSGQGSQYYGMGRFLREGHPGFARRLADLDRVASREVGCSILDIIYDEARYGDDLPFDRLLHSHPAILMIELALADTLRDAGVVPDYVLGTSLGELAAAVVAGAIGVEDAMRAVVHQARVAELHCPRGGMLAILGDVALAREPFIAANSEMISVDLDSYFVVAGTVDAIANIVAALRKRKVAHQELPVRYPFHCALIDAAGEPYRACLRELRFREPSIGIVSCVRGEIIHALGEDYFWQVARQPILFREGIAAVERLGKKAVYIDLGPSGSQAGLLTRALGSSARGRIHTVMSRFRKNTPKMLQHVIDAYGR